jgi:hypothetical protein
MRDLLSKLDAIVRETALQGKSDLQAKRKALQDLQMDPVASSDPEIKQAIIQRKADLEKEAKSKGIASESTSIDESIFEIGDEFGISFSEDHEIATTIVDILEDGIVIELDDAAMSMLTNEGITFLEGEVVNEDKQKGVDGKACWKGYKRMGTKQKGGKTVDNCVKMGEDSNVQEISKSTLGSYIKKATGSVSDKSYSSGEKKLADPRGMQLDKEVEKRRSNIGKAVNRLTKEDQDIDEAKTAINFDAEDIAKLQNIDDIESMKSQAFELISKPSKRPMKPEKVEWFKNALEKMQNKNSVIKLMYDLMLSGEGHGVVGSRSSMSSNTYRQRFKDDIDSNVDEYFQFEFPKGKDRGPRDHGTDELERREKSFRKHELAKDGRDYKDAMSPKSKSPFKGKYNIAGPKGKLPEDSVVALPDISGLGYDAQSLILKLRRDVEEKRLRPTRQAVLSAANELAGDMDFAPELLVRQVLGKSVAEDNIGEAEYQGRKVPLGKPMAGDVKKSKVYVKNPQGNVVKVNFGDKKMRIKKSNPARKKSFRARHNCDNPGPRHKARYWSCRAW